MILIETLKSWQTVSNPDLSLSIVVHLLYSVTACWFCDCLPSVLHWCSYSAHLKGVLPLQVHLEATSFITAAAFSQTVCLFILEGAKWAPYILLCRFAPRDGGHAEKPPPTCLSYCLDIQKWSALPAFSIFSSLRVHISVLHLLIIFLKLSSCSLVPFWHTFHPCSVWVILNPLFLYFHPCCCFIIALVITSHISFLCSLLYVSVCGSMHESHLLF